MSASRWSTGASPVVKTATRPVERGGRPSRNAKSSPTRKTRSLISARYAFRPGKVVGDEDPRRRRDRRDRGPAAVEDDGVRVEGCRELRALEHVRRERRPRHSSACTTAADSGHACKRSRLEMIRRRMAPRPRERDEVVDARRRRHELGLGGTAPPHRNDDDSPVARKQPRDVSCDGRLPDPLAGADHRDRRHVERMERRRVERKSAPTYGKPSARNRAANASRSSGVRTGSSERSTTISASPGSSTMGTP